MSLQSVERKTFILQQLQNQGKVRTYELSERLQVSSETIRRDLEELEKEEKCKRVYGGAVSLSFEKDEPSPVAREILHAEAKREIGRLAASLVKDRDVIVLDDGTTTAQVVPFLTNRKDLTIITPSLLIAQAILQAIGRNEFTGEVIILGGKLNPKHARTSGTLAHEMMERFTADIAFLSVDGLSEQKGFTSYEIERADLSRTFMKHANKRVVLVDSSKWEVTNFYQMANWNEIDTVICEREPPAAWHRIGEKREIEWLAPTLS